MSTSADDGEPVEPFWMIAANVVLWRRYGEGGQGQRPGTKMFKGGSKVYVGTTRGGLRDCEVVGRPRHGRGYRQSYVSTRHLHTFRPVLVRSPVLLRFEMGYLDEEYAQDIAVLLERYAWELRSGAWPDWPHPEPCHCHECLALRPHR
ncbi:hypothetical protein [Streptomyces sp. TBY4]|uniref:hypothetical protein n=1 Tax=Streptomyces sp. TBY4 TaxID=2962030 RepID=UPI0020B67788|nr:hypothetical protein [Streptomyces sp. TBY4]MCP3757329.1 hypothetical protein [Streptomyces sp. TBY4]